MKTSITMTKRNAERGFSLIEMIVYIAILTLLVTSLVMAAVSFLSTFVHMRAGEAIVQTGVVSLERFTREVRTASAVLTGASTLDTTPGVLALDSVDAAGDPITVTFTLTAGRITIQMGAAAAVPLTPAGVTVSNLVFHHVVGAETEAVRISFTATKSVRGTAVSKDYRSFIVLDAS